MWLLLFIIHFTVGDILFGNERFTANYAMWGSYVEEGKSPFVATAAPFPIDLCLQDDFSSIKVFATV